MRDGIRLATDLYLPDGPGPWPTLLCRLPYDKAGDECYGPSMAQWFVEHGYAVVLQDCRGKARSDGAPVPFVHERDDAYDTLEWISTQSWCAGPVGMFGDSYYGYTQWAAVASRHPRLTAITPRAAPWDYRDARFPNGVMALEAVVSYSIEAWVDHWLYDWDGSLDWSIRPLRDVAATALGGRHPRHLDAWARGRFPRAAHLQVDGRVAALHLGGFWDYVHRQTIGGWRRARTSRAAPQHLLLDARDHGWTPLRALGEAFDDPFATTQGRRTWLDDYLGPLLPFFDEYVAGRATYCRPPVTARMTGGEWLRSDDWPPPGTRMLSWFPDTSGTLTADRPRRGKEISWTHDPAHPVPSGEHVFYALMVPYGGSDDRPDLLRFSTAPLTAPLDLVGPASFTVDVANSAASGHLYARLWDVDGSSRARRIVEGAAAFRHSPVRVRVDLGHTAYRLPAGHRLRLEVSASCFPMYLLHPGTDDDPWTAEITRPDGYSMRVGGACPAILETSTLDLSDGTPT